MSKAEPIRTELMKFVTMRSPQLIDQKISKKGYIRHPQPSESEFLKKITEASNVEDSRKKVKEAIATFNHVANYEDLIHINPELYEFSEWLAKEQNNLTLESCTEKSTGVKLLSSSYLNKVWDNLFYQILTRESGAIRQAAMRLIVGHNFIEKLNDSSIETTASAIITSPKSPDLPVGDELIALYLRRIAVSKVIMPKAFTVEKKKVTKNDTKFPKFDNIQRKHSSGLSARRIAKLEFVEKDINKHEISYKSTKRKAKDKAELSYGKKIASYKRASDNESTGAFYEAGSIFNNKKGLSRFNIPSDRDRAGNSKFEYSEIGLKSERPNEPFEFSYDAPFALSQTKNLADATKKIIEKVGNKELGIADLRENVRTMIRKENDLLQGKIKGSKKVIKMQGGALSEEKDELYEFSISFTEDEIDEELSNIVLMTIETGYKLSYPTSTDLKLTVDDEDVYLSQAVEVVENEDKHIMLNLFPLTDINKKDKSNFNLTGTMQLDNGTELSFNVNGRLKNKYSCGIATVIGDEEEEEIQIYGVNKVGVADFRKVEQEICCYVPGEVSHIENVMAREYKEKHTRTLIGSETSTEESSSYEQENVSDTTSTSRNELQQEVQTVLNTGLNASVGVGTGVSGMFPGGSYNANTSFNLAMSTALSRSNREAKTMAQEITEKALERVIQNTSIKRGFKMTREFEENNRHGFDNREGDEHVTGVYRWVDKVYTNRLVNYGKRLMYEFMVPEPARFYKKAIEEKQEENPLINVLEKPKHPSELSPSLSSSSDITRGNYKKFASAYGVNIEAPKSEHNTVSQSITAMTPPNHKPFSESQDIYLPTDYVARKAEATVSFVYKYSSGAGPGFTLSIGGDQIKKNPAKTGLEKETYRDNDVDFNFGKSISDKVGVAIGGNKIYSFAIGVTIECELKAEIFEKWQGEVYEAIMAAYDEKMIAYENSQITTEMIKDEDEKNLSNNSAFNREIEIRELKRSCIEMITKPFDIPVGKSFYRKGENDIPEIKQNQQFEEYASHVKFFEQAFEWDIMAYVFYPYYWANRKKWLELFQLEDIADPIFQAFLQSGMSRVVVPVRPGFEEAVSYYMETGDIWNGGGLVLDSDDDLYLSIAEEMETIEGVVEEEWKTRVPSTLTVIQNSSVGLNAEGLPCCDIDAIDEFENSSNTLGRLNN
ncbi:MAG: hypothetical protein MK105_02585 [Crocinitomicaceae bacterium]|nr:hypothetical protein [Crocinitomicaceae bacterium]